MSIVCLYTQGRRLSEVCRRYPSTWALPVLCFLVLGGLGSLGVVLWKNDYEDSARARTLFTAQTIALGMEQALKEAASPAIAAALVVSQTPHWPEVLPVWEQAGDTMRKLISGSGLVQLQLVPFGVITATNPYTNLTGMHLDLFQNFDPNNLYPGLSAMISTGRLTVGGFGPRLDNGQLAIYIQAPIYVHHVSETELFGFKQGVSTGCTFPGCYNATTRTKWWGICTGVIGLTELLGDPRLALHALKTNGYEHQLTVLWPPSPIDPVISKTNDLTNANDAVVVNVSMVYDGVTVLQWELRVAHQDGCDPYGWEGILAAVLVASLLISLLLLWALLNMRENTMILTHLLPKEVVDKARSGNHFLSEHDPAGGSSGTPADKLMNLLTLVVEGCLPPAEDAVVVRAALMSHSNLYQPVGGQLEDMLSKLDVDADVMASLMYQLEGPRGLLQRGLSGPLASITRPSETITDVQLPDMLKFITKGGHRKLVEFDTPSQTPKVLQSEVPEQASLPLELLSIPAAISRKFNLLTTKSAPDTTPRSPKDTSTALTVFEPPDSPCTQGDVRTSPTVLLDQLERFLLQNHDQWTMDCFTLHELSRGRPLSSLAYFTLHATGLIETFDLPATKLARLLMAVEATYKPHPYHNTTHAADVTQTLHVLLLRSGMLGGYVEPLTHLACFLAAVAHDADHQGVTNDFLIASGEDLAVIYNDKSPQENYHAATLFRHLRTPGLDVLSHLSKQQQEKIRALVIDLIMATDMKQHMAISAQFATVHGLNSSLPSRRSSLVTQPADSRDSAEVSELNPIDENERMLSLQVALKVADIGNLAESLPVYLRWVECLEEEYFLQGDREKRAGRAVTPLMDRDKPGVSKSQPGFFTFVALPMVTNFVRVFQGAKPLLDHLTNNFRYWQVQPGNTIRSNPGAWDGPSPRSASLDHSFLEPKRSRSKDA